MYDTKYYFSVYLIFQILLRGNKLLLFLFSVSNFLRNMIRQKAHFRKSKHGFIPQTIFHLNLMLLLMKEIHVDFNYFSEI